MIELPHRECSALFSGPIRSLLDEILFLYVKF